MASWPLSVWEGDRLIYCLLEKFLSPLPQVPLVWCSPQGTCNLGLTVTLREAGTSEMVLPCQYLQLVCCVWVSNCLSLIQSLIVFFDNCGVMQASLLCASSSPLGSCYSLPYMRLEFFPDTGLLLFGLSFFLHFEALHMPFLHLGCPLWGLHACVITEGSSPRREQSLL